MFVVYFIIGFVVIFLLLKAVGFFTLLVQHPVYTLKQAAKYVGMFLIVMGIICIAFTNAPDTGWRCIIPGVVLFVPPTLYDYFVQ